MEMLQLNPPISVEVKGYGEGEACILFNPGKNLEPYWLVFIDASGESLTVLNSAIKKI